MKLSTKLSIGLLGIILILIIIQIVYGERVTNDLISLRENESIETLSGLKTMKEQPVEPFNEIEISETPVKILKGDKYTVFYGTYMKNLQIKQEKGKLIINSTDNNMIKNPVYIYLPQDPSVINFHHSSISSEIRGFEGKNTQINCSYGAQNIVTDLIFLNIKQKDNYSSFRIIGKDLSDTTMRRINAKSENSRFNLKNENLRTDLDMQLDQSSFHLNYDTTDSINNNIRIKGTVNSSSSIIHSYKPEKKDMILYCDTFLLDIKGFDPGQSYTIEIPNITGAKEYSIQKSDNVSIINLK